jgi:hypothetical protein
MFIFQFFKFTFSMFIYFRISYFFNVQSLHVLKIFTETFLKKLYDFIALTRLTLYNKRDYY